MKMAKTHRIRDDEQELIMQKRIDLIVKYKEDVKESDLIHILINKYIDTITIRDIEEYKENQLFKK